MLGRIWDQIIGALLWLRGEADDQWSGLPVVQENAGTWLGRAWIVFLVTTILGAVLHPAVGFVVLAIFMALAAFDVTRDRANNNRGFFYSTADLLLEWGHLVAAYWVGSSLLGSGPGLLF